MNENSVKVLTELFESRGIEYLSNEPMSRHTTFRIGGNAKLFVAPDDFSKFEDSYIRAKELGESVYILGKGSNVLFDDEGFDGVVLSTVNLDRISLEDNIISCFSGCSMTALSRFALDNSLSGLSFANGIPGSVGGAVFMNAGAYNGEVSNVLIETTYFDTTDGKTKALPHEKHAFSYRYSAFKDHPEWIIESASFKLKEGNYNEIKAEMDDFMSRRRSKQPLEYPSAGSVFKRYPGRYTAQMIDEAGLKGASVGGAEVSTKHAGFIINKGGATCRDVLELIDMIKNAIYNKFGIEIECEVIHASSCIK